MLFVIVFLLIVGDALYGTIGDNNKHAERWSTFGSDSPNMLFLAVDPVAVDSVMYDYLDRQRSVSSKAQEYLMIAANKGLGVYERWNNDSSREYTAIDYVEVDSDKGLCKGCFTGDTLAPSPPEDLSVSE